MSFHYCSLLLHSAFNLSDLFNLSVDKVLRTPILSLDKNTFKFKKNMVHKVNFGQTTVERLNFMFKVAHLQGFVVNDFIETLSNESVNPTSL